MVRRLGVLLAIASVLFACSHSATAPKQPPPPPPDSTPTLKDPTVDIYNNGPDRAYFTWRSGAAVLGADTIPGNTHRCEAFTAVADSAYWEVLDTNSISGNWAEVQTNYFDPSTRPAWNVAISEQAVSGGGVTIIQKDTTAECTP